MAQQPSAPDVQSAPPVSAAGTVEAPTAVTAQNLTLTDAIAMGQRSSPRLRAAQAAVDRAAGAVLTSRAYTNPQVQYLGGNQSARPSPVPGAPGLLQHYGASQTVEIPSERAARRNVAQLNQTGIRFRQSTEELSLLADIRRAFYEALRGKAEVALAMENLSLVEELRRKVEVEFRVGEKGRLELTRAEAELARAHFAVRSAQLEEANSIAVLRALIAAPPDAVLDPTGDLQMPIQLPPLPESRELVLKTNPQLAEAQANVTQSNAVLTHEKTLRLPQPTFYGEYERQPDQTFWRLGVTVPIPLWDRRRGQIVEASAATREVTALQDQRRIEILAGLEQAYNQYQLADQQATALESGSLHEAESAVEAAQAAYRFGERGIVEVLDAQRVLQSVRRDLLEARYARQAALIDLEQLGAITTGGRP